MTPKLTRAKAAHLARLLRHSKRLTGEQRIRYARQLLSWRESKASKT
jgi:hypothetical protein